MIYNTVCLGGGSIKALYQLGILNLLHEKNILKYENIDTFVGTSAGAIIVFLLNLQYTPIEIFMEILKINKWMDFNITLDHILNLTKDGGIFDISHFMKHVEDLIYKKLSIIPTLHDLYLMTNKKLTIVTTNITTREIEYLNYETHPRLSCIDALKMSCSIPIIFKYVIYDDNIYVDGGLLENFPINYVQHNEHNNIIGICTEGLSDIDYNFYSYVYTLFSLPIIKLQRQCVDYANIISKNSERCLIFNMKTKQNVKDYNISNEKKLEMFIDGYNFAKQKSIDYFLIDFDF